MIRLSRLAAPLLLGTGISALAIVALAYSHASVAVPSGAPRAVADSTTTQNPDEAAVQELVMNWIRAEDASALTGNTKELDALALPDSIALANDGASLSVSHDLHKAFYVDRYSVQRFAVNRFIGGARADIAYSAWGHYVSWPSLAKIGPEIESKVIHEHFEITKMNGKWLVGSVS